MGLGIIQSLSISELSGPLPLRASAFHSTAWGPPSNPCSLEDLLPHERTWRKGEMNGSPATPPLRVSEERAVPSATGLDDHFSVKPNRNSKIIVRFLKSN